MKQWPGKLKKISYLNKFGMREASKPIAWYANILVSLLVESGGEENQQCSMFLKQIDIGNLAIKRSQLP